jgi:hypothetical protein
MNTVENLKGYIVNNLGYNLRLDKVKGREKLPLYIRGAFDFYEGDLMGRKLLFALAPTDHGLSIGQIDKQFETITNVQDETPILVVNELDALSRKRLIDKGVNFIVPGKQMYLPALLVDLREVFEKPRVQKETLLPSAQVILLYRILRRYEKIEELTLKQIAAKVKYTPMGISSAVENLKYHQLCQVTGTKEKFIHFPNSIPELWHRALPLLTSPVINVVYIDELPKSTFMMRANESALPEYSDMNFSRQEFRAVHKRSYYNLKENGKLINLNKQEGRYCIEVWKYDPLILADGVTEEINVDPLSLYLSLKDNQDERIQMALDKIIEQNIW